MKDECVFIPTYYNKDKKKCGKPEAEHCDLTYKECQMDLYNPKPVRCKKQHHPFHRPKEEENV